MTVDVQRFWRDGYLHLPGVFKQEEILRWRERGLSSRYKGELLSDEVLGEVLLDDRILSTARQLLGDDPVYFGDSVMAMGETGWGFHKDNPDRWDGKGPDWSVERYPIIRFGIYTQDNGPYGNGGLELLRGSHLIADDQSGEYVAPDIKIGDLLVWNLRTSHTAAHRQLKLFGGRVLHNPLVNWVFRRVIKRINIDFLLQQSTGTRVAIFCTLAKESPLLERYLDYARHRAFFWKAWDSVNWSSDIQSAAKAKGLKLIDPREFKPDEQPIHENHYQPSY